MAAVAVLILAWLALSGLTMTGALRRGQWWPQALGAGLVFPVTWVVWYVRDQPALRDG